MEITLDRFSPRPYQIPIMDAIINKGYKRVLCVMSRRAGKDMVAFNTMLIMALKRTGVYFYLLPTYSQARKVIFDSITNDGVRFLDYIPKELITKVNQSEMKISLVNGSIIQLCGTDNIDTLVGTNPMGCVFSEAALQDPRAYQFLSPALKGNDGWALFISCVNPNTLVITKQGFKKIKNVSTSRQEYSDLNIPIYGLGGFHNAEQFYYGGKQKTLKITLESGYQLECTPIHPIWNGKEWIKSKNLNIGDVIPIQYGQNIWGNGLDLSDFYYKYHGLSKQLAFSIDDDNFFYLLGLIHADGNYDKNKVTVTKKKDPEIIKFLQERNFKTRLDGIHHEYNSKEFSALLEYMDFKHGARNKTFPEILFNCTKQQMKSFIQGIFDGDGTSNSNKSKRGYVKLTSTCLEFIKDLQVILLNFGIVSSVRQEDKAPTQKVKVWSRIYNLEITGYFAHVFYRDIGFRLERKQKNWKNVPQNLADESGNIYPIDIKKLNEYKLPLWKITNPKRISRRIIKELNDNKRHPYLEELLKEKFFYSPIKSIEESECEVFDFVIPDTHSFFSNGFISHNTPRGHNWFYDLYNIAKDNPQIWFTTVKPITETKHIPLEEIQKEEQEGIMSADLIQQEYYCSWEQGSQGSFYIKYIDKMKLNHQITNVPYDPSLPTWTSWDLGVRDSSAIIIFQPNNNFINIIDCYENSKEGLEHYINYLYSKPYKYTGHIAPHDIRVREFTSGMSRIDKARQLGIDFQVADNISIYDGIEAVRTVLPRCYIDQAKCVKLIKALENYRQEWDAKHNVYKPVPVHDSFSHFADAIRYLAVSANKFNKGMTPQDLERIKRQAWLGVDSDVPSFFNDYR